MKTSEDWYQEMIKHGEKIITWGDFKELIEKIQWDALEEILLLVKNWVNDAPLDWDALSVKDAVLYALREEEAAKREAMGRADSAEQRTRLEAIQKDAMGVKDDVDDGDVTEAIIESHKHSAKVYKEMAEGYKAKWHEARRYLRAANKGAERNAIALSLAMHRLHNQSKS